jgi:bacteriorhodopsin
MNSYQGMVPQNKPESMKNKDKNNKNQKKESKSDIYVKLTFYITYVFLVTTATITFIEALRTTDNKVRHILNLETCISVVATFFYTKFVTDMEAQEKEGKPIDYKKINRERYTDWMITTPIMLLVLCLAFVYNSKTSLNFFTYVIVLLLNFGMIVTGYLGEIGTYFSKMQSLGLGFVFFFALYGFLYYKFIHKQYNFDNLLIYLSFFVLWTFYGVVYMMDEVTKNVSFNILDLLAKCFVGIFFWAYFTGVFTLKK